MPLAFDMSMNSRQSKRLHLTPHALHGLRIVRDRTSRYKAPQKGCMLCSASARAPPPSDPIFVDNRRRQVNVTGKQKQRNTPSTAGPLLGMQGKNMDLEQSIQVLLTPGHHNNRRNDQKVFFISCVSQGRLDLAFKYISREPSPALYRTLLSCCTKANDFEGAKSVYMKQREAGFFPNEYVYSNLISAAGRANNVQDAQKYFEEAVCEDSVNTVVVNSILDAYGRAKRIHEVLSTYKRLKALDINENAETFNILMQTASRYNRHKLVKLFHQRMKRKGIQPTERTFAILLSSARKVQGSTVGLAGWAFQMIEEAKMNGIELNNHILSALFSACASEGKGIKRSKKILKEYMSSGKKPNINVWSSLIKLCGSTGEIDFAIKVCETFCKQPLSPYIRSALCSAIANNPTVECSKKALKWHNDAHKEWLMKMFKEDYSSLKASNDETVACNAAIHMCANLGLVQQAFRAYIDMRRCNLKPDCTTFNSLILACNRANQPKRAIKVYEQMRIADLEPDEVTYGVLIDTYANECQPDDAMRLFISMKQKGIEHNIVHYTSLINAYSKAGTQDSVQKSFLIYKMMKMSGISPNEVTLSCLIDACRRIYDVDRAFEYFVDACKAGIVPSDATYHHFLKICNANGRMEEALKVIQEMIDVHIKLKGPTIEALIRVLSKQHHVSKALEMLDQMCQMNFSPGAETLSSLLISCCRGGYTLEAYKLYHDIKVFPDQPSSLIFSNLITALGNANLIQELNEIYSDSQVMDDELNFTAKIAHITACCNAELLPTARDLFDKLISTEEWHSTFEEEVSLQLKNMFDTLIVKACRAGMTDFALKAFDCWRSATWEREKVDVNLAVEMRLSSVTLAFLESCCRRNEELEYRIFDICAEMRRQQYKKRDPGITLKVSHHFNEDDIGEDEAGEFG